jgi:hypothetical protein
MVLRKLSSKPMGVEELYQKVIKKLFGVNEFIDILDCLYALHKIEYDDEKEVLRYVI